MLKILIMIGSTSTLTYGTLIDFFRNKNLDYSSTVNLFFSKLKILYQSLTIILISLVSLYEYGSYFLSEGEVKCKIVFIMCNLL